MTSLFLIALVYPPSFSVYSLPPFTAADHAPKCRVQPCPPVSYPCNLSNSKGNSNAGHQIVQTGRHGHFSPSNAGHQIGPERVPDVRNTTNWHQIEGGFVAVRTSAWPTVSWTTCPRVLVISFSSQYAWPTVSHSPQSGFDEHDWMAGLSADIW